MWMKITIGMVLASALGLSGLAAEKERVIPSSDLVPFVNQRVQQWQPTAEERRFDEIGWCHSVLEAEHLARKCQRPIFWFTHDGKMSLGRC